MFEFKPFMDGYKQMKDILEKSKFSNMEIYDILNDQIGAALFKRRNKEMKAEELEQVIYDSVAEIK